MKSGVFKNSKAPYFLLFNDQECVLFADHRNLVGILSPKNIKIKAYASRIGRWSIDFSRINLKVYHLDGAKNIPVDCLSR
eukprot:maker-scaffold_1-snap-gene-16.21-mRNA-1 protein AED:0.73 eAED:0.94 QI:0/0/0/1/0/0/2/0/79